MSASLVGSEMCIRDSPRSDGLGHSPRTATPGDNDLQKASDLGLRTPVTYTHLTLPTICSV
eukprot:3967998-Alexandrium_andersonii.AAC.1